MQSITDVIGCALASYFNGNKESELIIREDCKITSIPVADFFRDPNEIAQDRIALSYCRRSVLNIGASSGEHSLYLMRKGLKVTSIDTSPVACSIMEKRGVPIVICGNIFENFMELETAYTWLALRGVVGQLGNIRQFFQFLDLAKRKIASNGRLILSSLNLDYEGYRTRHITFEYGNNVSYSVPWFDIGISSMQQIASFNGFNSRIIYCDENKKYIALLTRK